MRYVIQCQDPPTGMQREEVCEKPRSGDLTKCNKLLENNIIQSLFCEDCGECSLPPENSEENGEIVDTLTFQYFPCKTIISITQDE